VIYLDKVYLNINKTGTIKNTLQGIAITTLKTVVSSIQQRRLVALE